MFLALGGVCLLAGLNAALLLLGLPAPLPEAASASHGQAMTLGFMGSVIALERAQALGKAWGYLAPALLGCGGIIVALGATWLGAMLLTEGSAVLVLLYLALWRRAPLALVAVQVLSAVMALAAAGLTLLVPLSAVIPVLSVFLILTIAAERAELAQLALGPSAMPILLMFACALSLGAIMALLWPSVGTAVLGFSQAFLGAWLLRDDVPRRMIRSHGLRRYNAAALLPGYVWLVVGGLAWVLTEGQGAGYDIVIHTTFLGFGVSMIMAHAPIIFPTVLGRPLPYHWAFYAPLVLLHLGMTLRVIGDLQSQGRVWQLGGALNVAALLLFVLTALVAVLTAKDHA